MKRKTNLSLLASLLLGLSIASCSQGEALPASGEATAVPILIRTSWDAEVQSRVAGAPLPKGSAIGVFKKTENPTVTEYTLSSKGVWKSTAPIYVGAEKVRLSACYPYRSQPYSTLDTQIYTSEHDWSCATTIEADINNTNSIASFVFKKPYSQLSLEITRSGKYTLDCKVTQIKFEVQQPITMSVDKVDYQSAVGIQSGTGTSVSFPTSGPIKEIGIPVGKEARDKSCNYLFVPQSLAAKGGLKLTLTIDDTDYSVTVPESDLPALVRGTRHVIHLSIEGGVVISINQVSTKPWQTGSEALGDGGSIQDENETEMDVTTDEWGNPIDNDALI